MINRARHTLVALLVVLVAMSAACVSTSLPEGATPQHRYFAAVADYNLAKRAALKYVQEPTTSAAHTKTILDAVEKSDAGVKAFDQIRLGNCIAPEVAAVLPELAAVCVLRNVDYTNRAGALRTASAVLRRLAVE